MRLRTKLSLSVVVATLIASNAFGQDGDSGQAQPKHSWYRKWRNAVDRTKANQPDWLSPLATTSGRLKDELRYDVWRQPVTGGKAAWQLGGNKGLEFVATSRTQIMLGIPTYILQPPNSPTAGFGDLPLQLKFPIASPEHPEENYRVTFVLSAT